tara:strand:+ start:203 stop:700 length:498 start_codon:yes stop_codon:yes gene_type:complete
MGQADGKYWVANNPNSEITDTKAQKLAELSATSVTLAELNALDADSTQCAITPASTTNADGATVEFAVQFKDAAGTAIDYPVGFTYYVSADSAGLSLDTAVTTIADGGAGAIIKALTANQSGVAVTNAAGLCELDLTEAGADVIYLVVIMPDGRLTVSAAVTWNA